MQIKTKAIVLKSQDYNENDKLLVLLTEDMGLVYAYAFNARKLKNSLATASSMLCYGEFVLFKNRDKYTVDSAEPERLFFGIRNDLESLALASWLCELAISTVNREEAAPEIQKLLLNTLYFLENKKYPLPVLKAIFELRTLSLVGYAPDIIACSECCVYDKEQYWFDPKMGEATCLECRPTPKEGELPLSKAAFFAARQIVYGAPEQVFSFRIGESALRELSAATEKYTLVQLDSKFPTLDFLNTLLSTD